MINIKEYYSLNEDKHVEYRIAEAIIHIPEKDKSRKIRSVTMPIKNEKNNPAINISTLIFFILIYSFSLFLESMTFCATS